MTTHSEPDCFAKHAKKDPTVYRRGIAVANGSPALGRARLPALILTPSNNYQAIIWQRLLHIQTSCFGSRWDHRHASATVSRVRGQYCSPFKKINELEPRQGTYIGWLYLLPVQYWTHDNW
jgi:hypothetical protein